MLYYLVLYRGLLCSAKLRYPCYTGSTFSHQSAYAPRVDGQTGHLMTSSRPVCSLSRFSAYTPSLSRHYVDLYHISRTPNTQSKWPTLVLQTLIYLIDHVSELHELLPACTQYTVTHRLAVDEDERQVNRRARYIDLTRSSWLRMFFVKHPMGSCSRQHAYCIRSLALRLAPHSQPFT